MAELIIAKHRSGPTGTVRLVFRGQFTKFRQRRPWCADRQHEESELAAYEDA